MPETLPDIVIQLIKAKHAYYMTHTPMLSDRDYDLLEERLRAMDPAHPVLQLVGWNEEYTWWIRHYEALEG